MIPFTNTPLSALLRPTRSNSSARQSNRGTWKFVAIVIAAAFTIWSQASYAQAISRPFPFTLSAMDTNSTTLLPAIEPGPAGKHGVWQLSPDGHYAAQDGTRMKFFGTEIQFTANFLDSRSTLMVAKRIRKMGFNALRLNYMDYFGWDDASIFHYYQSGGVPDSSSYDVNPLQLAKLDTLLATLKAQGIYVFMTLNGVHHYSYGEGVATWDSMTGAYGNSTLMQFLYPQAAWLQHKWARMLTSHINPITGLALGKDPAIACYEIMQEQTIPFFWKLGRLNYVDSNDALDRGLNTLSFNQSRRLDTLFASYLEKKYGSDANVNAAWAGNQNVSQKNLLVNPSFELFDNSWNVFANPPATARQILVSPGSDGQTADLIHITSTGGATRPTDVLLYNTTARCGMDTLYQLSFWAHVRPSPGANGPRSAIAVVTDQQVNSLISPATIDTTWRQYTFTFRSQSSKMEYIGVYLSGDSGDVVFDNFVLKQIPEQGLRSGETLLTANVKRLAYDTMMVIPIQRARDQTMFYDSLQRSFYSGMIKLLRDTLDVAGLVNSSQANYWGTILDYHSYKDGEVTQTHTGWDYVSSRGSSPYSADSWMVRNDAMVSDNGFYALALAAAGSTAGKSNILGQWTVPNPNQNASEQGIIPPIYAAYQDWDGIFFTPYAGRREELFADTIVPGYATYSWSNIASNHALMSQMPLASYVFRNSLVPASNVFDTIQHDPDDVNLFPHYPANRGEFGQDGFSQVYQGQAIVTSIGVREAYDGATHQQAAENLFNHLPTDVTYPSGDTSETSKIVWNPTLGTFTATEPHVYAFTGFIADSVVFPQLTVERLDQSHDNLSLYYVFSDTMRQGLLSISTRTQNSGTRWIDSLGYGSNTGHAPTIMSAANLHLTFTSVYDTVRIYSLDSTGLPNSVMLAQRIGSSDKFAANIDQQTTQSVWYFVDQKMGPTAVVAGGIGDESLDVALAPNPAVDHLTVTLRIPHDARISISLTDDLGREVLVRTEMCASGVARIQLEFKHLSAGHYVLRASDGERMVARNINIIP